jgi:methylmalonyl-CoA/ethylmalonyl-CoA epimerase
MSDAPSTLRETAMIGRLNHVAIAVPDLEAAAAQYRDTLGAEGRPAAG